MRTVLSGWSLPLFIALVALGSLSIGRAQEIDEDRVRGAATRAVAAIQKAQATWYTTSKQVCGSCHHQYQPALAYRAAREHAIPVNESISRADAEKAFTFADIDRAAQYTYVI